MLAEFIAGAALEMRRREELTMTFGSLFAGIEGFGLGLKRAGMECAFQVEKDRKCQSVLRRHFPGVPLFGDIRNCHSEEAAMAGTLKKLTPDQASEAVKMYERGLSLAPIADYFNVTRQAMWDLLRRRTQLRPQKREGKDNHFYRDGKRADDQAQNLVETAISQGVLEQKSACENCGGCPKFKDGRTGVQAHHDDYNKPLEVRWLCQKCHHEWHKHNTPKRKEAQQGLPHADVVCAGFP